MPVLVAAPPRDMCGARLGITPKNRSAVELSCLSASLVMDALRKGGGWSKHGRSPDRGSSALPLSLNRPVLDIPYWTGLPITCKSGTGTISLAEVFMRVLVLVVAVIGLSCALAAPVKAANRTEWGQSYDSCRKAGAIIVWAPALQMYCGVPNPNLSLRDNVTVAIRACEKITNRNVPREWRGKFKCRLAYDGRQIRDSQFGRLINAYPDIRVKMKIYDAKTKKTQISDGILRRTTHSGRHVPFRLIASGATLCSGTYNFGFGARFKATCFGEQFSGSAFTDKIIKASGMYFIAPKKVKVTSKGSYIEVYF